jgi:hypothetical protein
VAVDANHIYWADGAGTINENDIGAFDFPVTLYSGPSGPEGLAVGP